MLTYKLHFIRHGLTQANLDGRYIGRTDEPLCQRGREELEALLSLGGYPEVEKVYASPLKRAVESARILFSGTPVELLPDLTELDFGAFENRNANDLENDLAFRKWTASPPSARTPGGESGEDLTCRAVRGVSHIFAQMMETQTRQAAVVTHGGVIMSILAAIGMPERKMVLWNCEPGHGYTALLSAQMWMRDQKIEVYERLPWTVEEET